MSASTRSINTVMIIITTLIRAFCIGVVWLARPSRKRPVSVEGKGQNAVFTHELTWPLKPIFTHELTWLFIPHLLHSPIPSHHSSLMSSHSLAKYPLSYGCTRCYSTVFLYCSYHLRNVHVLFPEMNDSLPLVHRKMRRRKDSPFRSIRTAISHFTLLLYISGD